jgi:glycosyltransferase involved in cell wall biosynthesis
MKITFISWAPYCSRSDHIARELGGSSHMVYLSRFGSHPATVAFKYAGQLLRTLEILRAERPEAVFVMTPPVFAVLAVSLYCRHAGIPYVIDSHTAAFLHPRWRYLQWLQNALCRRAATTIVTNEHLARMVEGIGGHATIVTDVPVKYERTTDFPTGGRFSVAVVCSFNDDEPIDQIIEAARDLPDVAFYMTGDSRQLRRDLAEGLPSNVTLTGFLSTAEYGGLLSRTDAVMALTTRNHTMLRGAYEAVYQGTPVIVSNWPLLREAFATGALHVDNSASGIVAAVREMQTNAAGFRAGVRLLRERKLSEWTTRQQELTLRISGAARPSAASKRVSRAQL